MSAQRTFEWQVSPTLSHSIKIDQLDAPQHLGRYWHDVEPTCDTCSIPYAIAELVKVMNRFSIHTLQIDADQTLFWLV